MKNNANETIFVVKVANISCGLWYKSWWRTRKGEANARSMIRTVTTWAT